MSLSALGCSVTAVVVRMHVQQEQTRIMMRTDKLLT
jgi:hypothetical protein